MKIHSEEYGKLFKKSINDDLEKLKQESKEYFSCDDILILLKLLSRYNRGEEGSNIINIANKLDLLMRDLKMLGEKNALNYIEEFIKNNWK